MYEVEREVYKEIYKVGQKCKIDVTGKEPSELLHGKPLQRVSSWQNYSTVILNGF
jgi:hypothetical protein